jgi:hypothetical protein
MVDYCSTEKTLAPLVIFWSTAHLIQKLRSKTSDCQPDLITWLKISEQLGTAPP